MESPIPGSHLSCELMFVEQSGSDLLIDAVTVEPRGDGDDHLPAGSPVTWWLEDQSGPDGGLATTLRRLARSDVGCRIGTVSWKGSEVLVAAGRDDCVVVLLRPQCTDGWLE